MKSDSRFIIARNSSSSHHLVFRWEGLLVILITGGGLKVEGHPPLWGVVWCVINRNLRRSICLVVAEVSQSVDDDPPTLTPSHDEQKRTTTKNSRRKYTAYIHGSTRWLSNVQRVWRPTTVADPIMIKRAKLNNNKLLEGDTKGRHTHTHEQEDTTRRPLDIGVGCSSVG